MPTPALMTGVPYNPPTLAGTGAVTGQIVAIPITQGKSERFVTVQLTFGADPGAYVFNPLISLDGVNFISQGTTTVSATTVGVIAVFRVNAPFFRLDQTSKANSVVATPTLLLE